MGLFIVLTFFFLNLQIRIATVPLQMNQMKGIRLRHEKIHIRYMRDFFTLYSAFLCVKDIVNTGHRIICL